MFSYVLLITVHQELSESFKAKTFISNGHALDFFLTKLNKLRVDSHFSELRATFDALLTLVDELDLKKEKDRDAKNIHRSLISNSCLEGQTKSLYERIAVDDHLLPQGSGHDTQGIEVGDFITVKRETDETPYWRVIALLQMSGSRGLQYRYSWQLSGRGQRWMCCVRCTLNSKGPVEMNGPKHYRVFDLDSFQSKLTTLR